MNRLPRRVSRILAVGDQPEDRIQRLTRGKRFTCVGGAEPEHERLRDFCMGLDRWLADLGLELESLTQEELLNLLRGHSPGVEGEGGE